MWSFFRWSPLKSWDQCHCDMQCNIKDFDLNSFGTQLWNMCNARERLCLGDVMARKQASADTFSIMVLIITNFLWILYHCPRIPHYVPKQLDASPWNMTTKNTNRQWPSACQVTRATSCNIWPGWLAMELGPQRHGGNVWVVIDVFFGGMLSTCYHLLGPQINKFGFKWYLHESLIMHHVAKPWWPYTT